MGGFQADLHQHQHQRDLDQNPHHGCQGRARRYAEQHRGGGNGHLKVVGRADHGRRCGINIAELQQTRQTIPQPENQDGLYKERDGDPQDGQRVADDYPRL